MLGSQFPLKIIFSNLKACQYLANLVENMHGVASIYGVAFLLIFQPLVPLSKPELEITVGHFPTNIACHFGRVKSDC